MMEWVSCELSDQMYVWLTGVDLIDRWASGRRDERHAYSTRQDGDVADAVKQVWSVGERTVRLQQPPDQVTTAPPTANQQNCVCSIYRYIFIRSTFTYNVYVTLHDRMSRTSLIAERLNQLK